MVHYIAHAEDVIDIVQELGQAVSPRSETVLEEKLVLNVRDRLLLDNIFEGFRISGRLFGNWLLYSLTAFLFLDYALPIYMPKIFQLTNFGGEGGT